jgi:hypothetical protein
MASVLLADAGILATSGMHTHKSSPISALPRRVPHPRNCRPSALEVILRRPQEPPELHNLLALVLTPCSPVSSHLARQRLHLHNGRRCPARQERTVRLSRLVDFHALLLSPQCHTTGPGMAPVLLADACILATSGMHTHKSAPIADLPRRVPHPRNCRPSALEVILRRPQEPPPPKVSHTARAHSLVAARPRLRAAAAPGLPRPPSCAPAHTPPSSHSRLQWPSASCACTSAMH